MRSDNLCDDAPSVVASSELPWHEGTALPASAFRRVREATIFDCCKWDPQVGDTSVLHPVPLILRADAWSELAAMAEALARETMEAEHELAGRPELHCQLGLPFAVRRSFRHTRRKATTTACRVLRFDFHWTTEGWRLSEVNSDVPGGFIEASGFTRLMADCVSHAVPAGDPVVSLIDALLHHTRPAATIGLVHATGYTDDRQVMVYLARLMRLRGLHAILLNPADVRWSGPAATGHDGTAWRTLDVVYRFFPAEWIPNLGWFQPWRGYFRASATPQINPPTALLTQSKRFPLVWDELASKLTWWRKLLPATCDPRRRPSTGDDWVLKPALGRVGDGIDIGGATPPDERVRIQRAARRHPNHWAAQRKFDAVPWQTSSGALYPAIGVYVIDGHAAGIYARAAERPLVDARAFDIAALVEVTKETFLHGRSPSIL